MRPPSSIPCSSLSLPFPSLLQIRFCSHLSAHTWRLLQKENREHACVISALSRHMWNMHEMGVFFLTFCPTARTEDHSAAWDKRKYNLRGERERKEEGRRKEKDRMIAFVLDQPLRQLRSVSSRNQMENPRYLRCELLLRKHFTNLKGSPERIRTKLSCNLSLHVVRWNIAEKFICGFSGPSD